MFQIILAQTPALIGRIHVDSLFLDVITNHRRPLMIRVGWKPPTWVHPGELWKVLYRSSEKEQMDRSETSLSFGR